MGVFLVVLTLAFSVTVSAVEIPKMLKNKEYKEIAVFSVILIYGTIIALMESFGMKIPNPGDFVAFVYSPVSNLIKGVLE